MYYTKEELEKIGDWTIFENWIALIEHPRFRDAKKISEWWSLEEDWIHTKVKWVAVKWIVDWTIYHSLDANLEYSDYLDWLNHLNASNEQIARCGAKLYNRDLIRKLVDWDDEFYKLYRI